MVDFDNLPYYALLSYAPLIGLLFYSLPLTAAMVITVVYAGVVALIFYFSRTIKQDLDAIDDEVSNMTAGHYSSRYDQDHYIYDETRRIGSNIEQAMRNVREKIGDVKEAEEIQELLIPESIPNLPDTVDFHFTYEPALLISGDACDLHYDPEREVLDWFIADVSGHGTGSGMVMAMFKVAHEMARLSYDDLADRARVTNRALGKAIENPYIRIYGILGRLDLKTTPPRLQFLNVCLEPPVVEINRDVKRKKGHEMNRYGVGFGEPWNSPPTDEDVETFDLRSGNAVIFYTDGSTETRNEEGEYFGYDRLVNVVDSNPPTSFGMKGCLHKITGHVEDYGEPSDDITLMGFSRRSD